MKSLIITTSAAKELRKELLNKCYRYRWHISIVFTITILLAIASSFFIPEITDPAFHYSSLSINNYLPTIISTLLGVYLIIILNLPDELKYQQYISKGRYTPIAVNSIMTIFMIILYSLIITFIPYIISAILIAAGSGNDFIFTDGLIINSGLVIFMDYLLSLLIVWGCFSVVHKLLFMIKHGTKWTYAYIGSVLISIAVALIILFPLYTVNFDKYSYDVTRLITDFIPFIISLLIFESINGVYAKIIARSTAL